MSTQETTPELEHFERALSEEELEFQRCKDCQHCWLPPRSECPSCWGSNLAWEEASGDAHLLSWVIYHRAYHPDFEDRIPYNVALVKLVEGPQMVTNIVAPVDWSNVGNGTPLRLVIETQEGRSLARFKLA